MNLKADEACQIINRGQFLRSVRADVEVELLFHLEHEVNQPERIEPDIVKVGLRLDSGEMEARSMLKCLAISLAMVSNKVGSIVVSDMMI